MDMHHFARRTAAFTLALAVATLLFTGCSKNDNKDNDPAAATTTTAVTTAHDMSASGMVTETRIATQGGEIAVSGHILTKYTETGGPEGTLGRPSLASVSGPDGGSCQEFAGGAVCYSDQTGAHVVWGDIRTSWEADGGINGTLGYPTSDEKDNADGTKESDFTGGSISWKEGQTTTTTK
jgi:uncharacterized protein with LGFP repeats